MDKWPAGVRPSGKGIRIKIWKHGKLIYSETLPGDPYKKADLAAAVKRRDDLVAKQRLGQPLRHGDEGVELFGDVAERWLASLQIDKDTIRGYMNHLNHHWMPAYASWPINEITQADILERLAATNLATKTQKNIVGPLRNVLAHARMNPNPANNINWPKRQGRKKKIQRYLPQERDKLVRQLAKIAQKADILAADKPTQKNLSIAHWAGQARVYFPLLFATGLRPGEALGLYWRDYDGGYLSVTKQHTRGKAKDMTKTGDDRRVFVPSWVRPILDAHPTRFKEGAIFVGFLGGPLKDSKRLNPVWDKAHDKARLHHRIPYVCRHTRAAELLSRGVGSAEAAAELGHSTQMFYQIYSEWIEEYAGDRDMSRFESAPTKHRQEIARSTLSD